MALTNLLAQSCGRGLQADDSLAGKAGLSKTGMNGALKTLHYVPKAKRIIWLYMAGGMSHLDTFDNKPKLVDLNGQPMP